MQIRRVGIASLCFLCFAVDETTPQNTRMWQRSGDRKGFIQYLIQDIQINENAGTCNHYYPTASMDHDGNFVVAWADERNANNDIYCQLFDQDGEVVNGNFIVNDDGTNE